MTKWKTRADAPDSHEMREQFRRGLKLSPEDGAWLYSGNGSPPEPELWKRWIETPSYLRVAQQLKVDVAGEEPPSRKKRRAAGEKRKRD